MKHVLRTDDVLKQLAERQTLIYDAIKKGRGGRVAQRLDKYVGYSNGKAITGNLGMKDTEVLTNQNNAISFVISTRSVDRDGDIVDPAGYEGSGYALNPVWMFGHGEWSVPIGTARAPDGHVAVYPGADLIKSTCFFDRDDEDADFLYGKCVRKILGATSVAFVPIIAHRRTETEKAYHGDGDVRPTGYLFSAWAHTETSIVAIPANPEAVAEITDSLIKEKSFVSPRMLKALRPMAAIAKGRSFSGWCPPGYSCTKDGCVKVPVVKAYKAGDVVVLSSGPNSGRKATVIADNGGFLTVRTGDEKHGKQEMIREADVVPYRPYGTKFLTVKLLTGTREPKVGDEYHGGEGRVNGVVVAVTAGSVRIRTPSGREVDVSRTTWKRADSMHKPEFVSVGVADLKPGDLSWHTKRRVRSVSPLGNGMVRVSWDDGTVNEWKAGNGVIVERSLVRKDSFFGSCDRDELGHCKPGTGGGSSGSKPGNNPSNRQSTAADQKEVDGRNLGFKLERPGHVAGFKRGPGTDSAPEGPVLGDNPKAASARHYEAIHWLAERFGFDGKTAGKLAAWAGAVGHHAYAEAMKETGSVEQAEIAAGEKVAKIVEQMKKRRTKYLPSRENIATAQREVDQRQLGFKLKDPGKIDESGSGLKRGNPTHSRPEGVIQGRGSAFAAARHYESTYRLAERYGFDAKTAGELAAWAGEAARVGYVNALRSGGDADAAELAAGEKVAKIVEQMKKRRTKSLKQAIPGPVEPIQSHEDPADEALEHGVPPDEARLVMAQRPMDFAGKEDRDEELREQQDFDVVPRIPANLPAKHVKKGTTIESAARDAGKKAAFDDVHNGTQSSNPYGLPELHDLWQRAYDENKRKILAKGGYFPGHKVTFTIGRRTYHATVVPGAGSMGYVKVKVDQVIGEGGYLQPGKTTEVQSSALSKSLKRKSKSEEPVRRLDGATDLQRSVWDLLHRDGGAKDLHELAEELQGVQRDQIESAVRACPEMRLAVGEDGRTMAMVKQVKKGAPNFLDKPKQPGYGKFIVNDRFLVRTVETGPLPDGRFKIDGGGINVSVDGVLYDSLRDANAAVERLRPKKTLRVQIVKNELPYYVDRSKQRWDICVNGVFAFTEWANSKKEAEEHARAVGNFPPEVKVEARKPGAKSLVRKATDFKVGDKVAESITPTRTGKTGKVVDMMGGTITVNWDNGGRDRYSLQEARAYLIKKSQITKSEFATGDRVVVTDGPKAGKEGTVIQQHGAGMVRVSFEAGKSELVSPDGLKKKSVRKGLPEAIRKLVSMGAANVSSEVMGRLEELNGITVTVDFKKLPKSVFDESSLASFLGANASFVGNPKYRTVKPPSGIERDYLESANVKIQKSIRKYITHDGSKWTVHAENGRVLGTHDSKADAEAQLRAVEANKHKSVKKAQMLIVNATEFDLSEASSSTRGHPCGVADGATLAPLGASDGPPANDEITFQGRRYRAKPRDGNSAWRVLVPKSWAVKKADPPDVKWIVEYSPNDERGTTRKIEVWAPSEHEARNAGAARVGGKIIGVDRAKSLTRLVVKFVRKDRCCGNCAEGKPCKGTNKSIADKVERLYDRAATASWGEIDAAMSELASANLSLPQLQEVGRRLDINEKMSKARLLGRIRYWVRERKGAAERVNI